MQLTDQIALVTGAGSGIGRAAALRLASEGAAVGVLSHTEESVQTCVDEIRAAGGRALPLVADVSDSEQMRAAVEALVHEFGGLDIIFANAGINGVWAPIDELQPEEWSRTINTNLTGTYLTLHHGVPHLKKRGGGSIVITSSINGTRVFSNAGSSAYSCTKAAQLTLTQMQAVELAKHNIRVNAICPGRIETAIQAKTVKGTSKKPPRTWTIAAERYRSPAGKGDQRRRSPSCSSSWCRSGGGSSRGRRSGSTAPNRCSSADLPDAGVGCHGGAAHAPGHFNGSSARVSAK
jgi:NAD(P)-dependent dehydrogenase (short-subunit alcohol dehydrogenase family)